MTKNLISRNVQEGSLVRSPLVIAFDDILADVEQGSVIPPLMVMPTMTVIAVCLERIRNNGFEKYREDKLTNHLCQTIPSLVGFLEGAHILNLDRIATFASAVEFFGDTVSFETCPPDWFSW